MSTFLGLRTMKIAMTILTALLVCGCGTRTPVDLYEHFPTDSVGNEPYVHAQVVPCDTTAADDQAQQARHNFDEQLKTVSAWCQEGSKNACKRYESMLTNRSKLVSEEIRRVRADTPVKVCNEYHYPESYIRWRVDSMKLCEQTGGGPIHCWND